MLHWLASKGFEVVAFTADVGQKEDFGALKEKALSCGASKVVFEDLKQDFVEGFIFKALKAGAVYESEYLLGTSLSRPLIAKKQVEVALKEGTNVLAHGATGKGNDQVRFEFAWMKFLPAVKIVSPWKDAEWLSRFKGRNELIGYAKEHGIPVKATSEKPYSVDENLMHASYEGGSLEDPGTPAGNDVFKLTVSPMQAPDLETLILVEFKEGIPVKVVDYSNGVKVQGSLELFNYLNSVGAKNGVGRVDLVENRFIGIKSRGAYESPGATILWKAHQHLESITLDREVAHLKQFLSIKVAELVYNGFWFSPEMEFLMAAVEKSQETVSGGVLLSLYKGNVMVKARESQNALYSQALSSMSEDGGFDALDSKGFIKVHGLRFKLNGLKGAKHEVVGKKLQA